MVVMMMMAVVVVPVPVRKPVVAMDGMLKAVTAWWGMQIAQPHEMHAMTVCDQQSLLVADIALAVLGCFQRSRLFEVVLMLVVVRIMLMTRIACSFCSCSFCSFCSYSSIRAICVCVYCCCCCRSMGA